MARQTIDELHHEATDAEVAKVNEALLNGDSLPAGFTFSPHGKQAVMKLKNADAEPPAPAGEGA